VCSKSEILIPDIRTQMTKVGMCLICTLQLIFRIFYFYWIVHHCDSWRIKDQLDVTCYFISLLMCSTCFGHSYIHHQELATILLNYQIGRLFLVRCVLEFRCGSVGVVSALQASACNTDTTPTQPHWNSNTHRTKNKRPMW